jgi:hypothetical protein
MTMLDDDASIQILKTIAQARLRADSTGLEDSPDLRAALADAFGNPAGIAVSEGDVARAALDLLAEDPAFAEPIRIMSRNAAGKRYIEPATIALTTAALLVLQTRVKFKRGQNGKWSVEVEKKAAGDGAVKALVQKLLGLLGG